jgi:hypothetical protein
MQHVSAVSNLGVNMRVIKIIKIEGAERKTAILYSFKEMVKTLRYDRANRLEIDKDIQERDNPVGWIIKEKTKEGRFVYIPVYDTEKFEYVDGLNKSIKVF